ncbi:MAG: 4-hydroxy-3-methylbut-2-enyl diphosphate reductase [Bryobacterales bacterium]|jgi:4-hydroxy-3-methylbut-2-enyl diphosphate reductase|nr:4-hydroxy-3-methylbut-2-enyl diphosphate reductase [Bryobacterales bacterium]
MAAFSDSPQASAPKKVILLKPRGFCAGVVRAIDVVKLALEFYPPPIYVLHEIVHNKHVVNELRDSGAVFVDAIEEAPIGSRIIFSAHGVSPEVRNQATNRKLNVIDATCPLVTKVHMEAIRFAKQDYSIVLIGHRDHEETIGTMGEAPDHMHLVSDVSDVDLLQLKDESKVVYLTQTTLSLDETRDIIIRLKERFPAIQGPPSQDICYATENRQLAVKAVAPLCQLLLVVGSQNSSNSKRLVEVCMNAGIPSYLVDDASELQPEWLAGVSTVSITAGASAPEVLVQGVIARLRTEFQFGDVEEMELKDEDVRFSLPPELKIFEPKLQTVAN